MVPCLVFWVGFERLTTLISLIYLAISFHSSQDSRLPAHFECFECRLAKNAYISFLSAHEKELMFAELNQLALMRLVITFGSRVSLSFWIGELSRL